MPESLTLPGPAIRPVPHPKATAIRSARGTSYAALMMFAIVYLGTLAIVFVPDGWLHTNDVAISGESDGLLRP